MAWYKVGTINVTNNSTTVAGVGTAWVGAVLRGEGVVMPNGVLYEIDLVNSGTSITLARPYTGPTASGQSYSICPIQDYIKLLASQAAELLNAVNDTVAGVFGIGSEGLPSIRTGAYPNTGLNLLGGDELSLVTGGVDRFKIGSTGTPSGTTSDYLRSRANHTGTQLPDTIAGLTQWQANPTGVQSINGGQLAGMRNKIINGKVDISQRGPSFAAVSGGSYLVDRWVLASNIHSIVQNASQQSDVPSNNEFQNSLRITVTTAVSNIAAGELFQLVQRIEGYDVRDLIGKTFTLSFWVRSSKAGTHCVSFSNVGLDRCYIKEYTINSANTWEYKTVTVTGGLITAGNWNWTNGAGLIVRFALAAGSAQHATANAWQTGSFISTSNQVNCLDTVGNIFAITGVQLEVGEVATPFEHRPYGMELALCQRYFFRYTAPPDYRLPILRSSAGTTSAQIQNFPVPMRAAPTGAISTQPTIRLIRSLDDQSTNVPYTTLSTVVASQTDYSLEANASSPGVVQLLAFAFVADFSSEL